MNINRLHLIEQELEALQKSIFTATCAIYTIRCAQSANVPFREWLQLRKVSFQEPYIPPEGMSQERIMFWAEEIIGVAQVKLEMLTRQIQKLQET